MKFYEAYYSDDSDDDDDRQMIPPTLEPIINVDTRSRQNLVNIDDQIVELP